MSFKVLVDSGNGPEVAVEVDDRRVTRVSLMSWNGEVGAVRIPGDQTEILLKLEYTSLDGRPTLEQIESQHSPALTGEEADKRIEEQQALPTATNQGEDRILNANKEDEEDVVGDDVEEDAEDDTFNFGMDEPDSSEAPSDDDSDSDSDEDRSDDGSQSEVNV